MTALSIGNMFKVFEPHEVAKALDVSEGLNNPLLTRMLREMLAVGPERFLVKPSDSACLDSVSLACPHFQPVIDDLRKYVELALFGTTALSFAPILLAGDPGVGKTYFAKQLGKALGVPAHFISMGGVSAGWVLSGAAPTWHGAKQGKVAQTFITEQFANPIFILDELDKTGGDARYDPTGTLLELLERETSSHFHDEFLDLTFNVSQAMWIATANDLAAIPAPLRSRMLVYEVKAPTPEQAAHIAQRIFSALCAEHGLRFQPELNDDVCGRLSTVAPRDMKMRVLEAMGAARVARRDHLLADDIRAPKPAKSIGFTA